MLTRLIYTSRVSPGVDSREVRDILAVSQRNNAERGLTGALLFNSKFFIQWLEGSRSAVNERFRVIGTDKRHYDAEILDYTAIDRRTFAAWTMGYAGEGTMNGDLLFEFCKTRDFNPFSLSAESSAQLIRELAEKSLTLEPAH